MWSQGLGSADSPRAPSDTKELPHLLPAPAASLAEEGQQDAGRDGGPKDAGGVRAHGVHE